MQETRMWSVGQEDPLEKGMATHSSIFAERILWTEEPGRLQSIGSQRVRHNWVTNTHMCSPQGAFPARLKKVLIVGAPIWFRVPYSIISLLLKDKVRERVRQANFIIWRWDRYSSVSAVETCQLILCLQKPSWLVSLPSSVSVFTYIFCFILYSAQYKLPFWLYYKFLEVWTWK